MTDIATTDDIFFNRSGMDRSRVEGIAAATERRGGAGQGHIASRGGNLAIGIAR
jgi:hypothetical protein